MPAERRAAVVELAKRWSREHRIHVIADDAYRELRFEGDEVANVCAFDEEGDTVIATGTFSKSFSPGIRVGWGILPDHLVAPVCNQKGNIDFGSPNFDQQIMAKVLELGLLDTHIERIRDSYRRKRDVMLAAANEYLRPIDGVRWLEPQGGLYVWAKLPNMIETGPTPAGRGRGGWGAARRPAPRPVPLAGRARRHGTRGPRAGGRGVRVGAHGARPDRRLRRARAAMKLLHVITTLDVGGAEAHLLSQVRAQVERGHAVRVAWLKGAGRLAQDFEAAGAEWVGRVGSSPLALLRLRAPLAWCEVVHSHLLKADALAAVAATLLGKRRRLISGKHNDERALLNHGP